jgi:Ca2+-transporting ATPase
MGKRGTDVAREAASLVLLEDDFGSIVAAIRLGRRIFANLRQAMVYTLAVHIPIIGLSVLPVMFGMPLILAPIHIAFLELIIDPACSIVFEAEPGDPGLMEQPPRSVSEHLVSTRQLVLSLVQGGLVTLAAATFYFWSLSNGIATDGARALAFIVLVVANAVLIFPSRSPESEWRQMFTGLTPVVPWVLGGTLSGLLIVLCVPAVAVAFSFQAPTIQQGLVALGTGVGLLFLFEVSKKVLNNSRPSKELSRV